MARYVALLRGINVGGNNLIRMSDLKACLEKDGLQDVETYIASGNVLFTAGERSRSKLTARVERVLERRFKIPLSVVLRSAKELQQLVASAPKGFGTAPDEYRYDVLFLKEPLTAKAALAEIPRKEGVDQVWAGKGVLYYSRLVRLVSQSRISKVVALPLYKQLTIRNWNTTSKLAALLAREERPAAR